MEKKVILITGSSSGIGKATSEYLAKKGYRVIGTSRKAQSKENTSSIPDISPCIIKMDITDKESIKKSIAFPAGRFLVSCAARKLINKFTNLLQEKILWPFQVLHN